MPGYSRRHFLEHALPQRVPLRHRVALIGHADAAAAVCRGEFERVTDDAVNAFVGVQLLLDGDFVFGAGLEASADADIQPFRVLAEDHEVDVSGRPILERAQAARPAA